MATSMTHRPFHAYIDAADPSLEPRTGPPPLTTAPSGDLPHPHQQLTQAAPEDLRRTLVRRAAALPGVAVAPSCVSVPGACAFHLAEHLARGPAPAFQCGREFAHVHPVDGSLHLTLPVRVHREVVEKGWGEPHPLSGTMLVFGPRRPRELEVVWQILVVSYRFALGDIHVEESE